MKKIYLLFIGVLFAFIANAQITVSSPINGTTFAPGATVAVQTTGATVNMKYNIYVNGVLVTTHYNTKNVNKTITIPADNDTCFIWCTYDENTGGDGTYESTAPVFVLVNLSKLVQYAAGDADKSVETGTQASFTLSEKYANATINSVEYFVNNVSVKTVSATPFVFNYTPATDGAYGLDAVVNVTADGATWVVNADSITFYAGAVKYTTAVGGDYTIAGSYADGVLPTGSEQIVVVEGAELTNISGTVLSMLVQKNAKAVLGGATTVSGTFEVADGGTVEFKTATLTGGTFKNSVGSTVETQSATGLYTGTTASGSVQTNVRIYADGAKYIFDRNGAVTHQTNVWINKNAHVVINVGKGNVVNLGNNCGATGILEIISGQIRVENRFEIVNNFTFLNNSGETNVWNNTTASTNLRPEGSTAYNITIGGNTVTNMSFIGGGSNGKPSIILEQDILLTGFTSGYSKVFYLYSNGHKVTLSSNFVFAVPQLILNGGSELVQELAGVDTIDMTFLYSAKDTKYNAKLGVSEGTFNLGSSISMQFIDSVPTFAKTYPGAINQYVKLTVSNIDNVKYNFETMLNTVGGSAPESLSAGYYGTSLAFDSASYDAVTNISKVWNMTESVDVTLAEFLDITPPVTTIVSPANGATGVALDTKIIVGFSEELNLVDPNTVVTFKETDASGSDVAFIAVFNATKDTITITPTATLTNGQLYYLEIGIVDDLAGNKSVIKSATFTTDITNKINIVDVTTSVIYPNPSQGLINISTPVDAVIEVVNVLGEFVTVIDAKAGISSVSLTTGTYFVKINGKATLVVVQ